MINRVLLTDVSRHPGRKGIATLALHEKQLTADYLELALKNWIGELLSMLPSSSLLADPRLSMDLPMAETALEEDCEPSNVQRLVRIKTHCQYGVFCCEGPLADVQFINSGRQIMHIFRIPGPYPFLVNHLRELVGETIEVIQHGMVDLREIHPESDQSIHGCICRETNELTLAKAGFGQYVQHDENFNIINVFPVA